MSDVEDASDSEESTGVYEEQALRNSQYKQLRDNFNERVAQVLDRKRDQYAERTPNGYVFRSLEWLMTQPEWQKTITYTEFGKPKKKGFVRLLSEDPLRATRSTAVFAPPPSSVPAGALNLYVGTAVEEIPRVPDDMLPGELLVHIGRLAGIRAGQLLDGDVRYEYLMDWLAQMFQSPGELSRTMLILWSEDEGCGKSSFTKFIGAMLGGFKSKNLYQAALKVSDVTGKHSDAVCNRLLLVLDDVEPKELKKHYEPLMNLVTEESSTTEPKWKQATHGANFCRFIWASTQEVLPMRSEKKNRRIWVLECDPKLSEESTVTYHQPLVEMMNDRNVQRAFYQMLMARNLEGKDWIESRPPSDMMKRWMKAADSARAKPARGRKRETRMETLREYIDGFTSYLAQTYDTYKKRFSPPEEGPPIPDGTVWEDFMQYMESTHTDYWGELGERGYNSLQFSGDLKKADVYDAWPKGPRDPKYKRINGGAMYTLDIDKVRQGILNKRPRLANEDAGASSGVGTHLDTPAVVNAPNVRAEHPPPRDGRVWLMCNACSKFRFVTQAVYNQAQVGEWCCEMNPDRDNPTCNDPEDVES